MQRLGWSRIVRVLAVEAIFLAALFFSDPPRSLQWQPGCIGSPVKHIVRNFREPSLPAGANQERRSGEASQARNGPPLSDVATGEDPKIWRGVCSPAGAGLQLPLHLELRVGMEFRSGTFPIVYQPAVALAQRAEAAAQLGVGPKLRVTIIVGHVHTAGHVVIGRSPDGWTTEPIDPDQLPFMRPAVLYPERRAAPGVGATRYDRTPSTARRFPSVD